MPLSLPTMSHTWFEPPSVALTSYDTPANVPHCFFLSQPWHGTDNTAGGGGGVASPMMPHAPIALICMTFGKTSFARGRFPPSKPVLGERGQSIDTWNGGGSKVLETHDHLPQGMGLFSWPLRHADAERQAFAFPKLSGQRHSIGIDGPVKATLSRASLGRGMSVTP